MVAGKPFSFNIVRVTKLKKLEYKVDTGIDGNLMPLNMFKVLFQRTSVAEVAQYKYTKVILSTYKNPHIPQLYVCKVKVIHKNKQNPFRFGMAGQHY